MPPGQFGSARMNNKYCLSGKRIVNTRPKRQATLLSQLITERGGDTLEMPTLEVEYIDVSVPLSQLQPPLSFAIFTSANAVWALQEHWQHDGIFKQIIAIGNGTAAALKEAGIRCDLVPQQHSSEGVLQCTELQQVAHCQIVIFCGENNRPLLKTELTQRSAFVTEIHCYRRQTKAFTRRQRQQLLNSSIDYVVCTSGETLHSFLENFTSKELSTLAATTFVVITEGMQQSVKSAAPSIRSVLAKSASPLDLLQAIENDLLQQ